MNILNSHTGGGDFSFLADIRILRFWPQNPGISKNPQISCQFLMI